MAKVTTSVNWGEAPIVYRDFIQPSETVIISIYIYQWCCSHPWAQKTSCSLVSSKKDTGIPLAFFNRNPPLLLFLFSKLFNDFIPRIHPPLLLMIAVMKGYLSGNCKSWKLFTLKRCFRIIWSCFPYHDFEIVSLMAGDKLKILWCWSLSETRLTQQEMYSRRHVNLY